MVVTAEAVEVKNARMPEKTAELINAELTEDLADWMTTNRDEVWRPAIELTKEDSTYVARALVPGVVPGNMEVMVAPDILLLKGQAGGRKIQRSIQFPQPVNPNKVHAEIEDGMLCVRVEIAQAFACLLHAA
jgi:HSP20 family molecular chaperone IbpA